MAHTPGPWKAKAYDDDGPTRVIEEGTGHWLAELRYHHESVADNARLIAAAPQMLKACEWALDMLKSSEDAEDVYPYSIDLLTNAIRAAKGE